MTATIVPERLALLNDITLDKGAHTPGSGEYCAVEFADYLAGGRGSTRSTCISPVIRDYVIALNDRWDEETRQRLKPYLPRIVGTGGDGQDEARSYLALDWLVREFTPAWLDLAGLAEAGELRGLPRIVDLATAKAAGPVVRGAGEAAAAAWDAAWDAARDAARDALRPTVERLQASALDLLDRMISPSEVTS